MGPIDILVNNAALEQIAFCEQLSEAEIDHYLTVNLTAPIQLTRLVLPGMLARGQGHIVIASIATSPRSSSTAVRCESCWRLACCSALVRATHAAAR
jgi:short-subunit dehydrogenase